MEETSDKKETKLCKYCHRVEVEGSQECEFCEKAWQEHVFYGED